MEREGGRYKEKVQGSVDEEWGKMGRLNQAGEGWRDLGERGRWERSVSSKVYIMERKISKSRTSNAKLSSNEGRG